MRQGAGRQGRVRVSVGTALVTKPLDSVVNSDAHAVHVGQRNA